VLVNQLTVEEVDIAYHINIYCIFRNVPVGSVLENWHKGSSAPSINSAVANEERMIPTSNGSVSSLKIHYHYWLGSSFPLSSLKIHYHYWLGSVLCVSFSDLTLSLG